jgi:putative toxin-antitoxin system antitoxin component (TIGR02293 family)
MTELFEAAELLGLTKGRDRPKTAVGVISKIEEGFTVDALHALMMLVAPGDVRFRNNIVPKQTYFRYVRSRRPRRLNKSQSATIASIAEMWAAAIRVWKTPEAARAFLNRPHQLLENKTPMEIGLTGPLGAEVVRDILGRLEHGTAV